MSDQEQNLEALLEELATVQSKIEALQDELNTAQFEIDELQSELDSRESEIDHLESALDRWENGDDGRDLQVCRLSLLDELVERLDQGPKSPEVAKLLAEIQILDCIERNENLRYGS